MEGSVATATRGLTPSLPADLTSFVGRRAEVAEVKRLLANHRLVTVMGVGGVGKTRVALRVAGELRRSVPDGVTWVELADLRDPALLAQTVEDALSVSDKTGREPLSNLANHLRDRNALIVLDNVEHVLERCGALVAQLLRAAPSLRLLVTSRQTLGVPGERLLSLAPLPVPDERQAAEDGAAIAYPSMALFAEQPRRHVPGSLSMPTTKKPWPRSAVPSRGSHWRSSWRPCASVCCRSTSWRIGSTRLETLGRGSLQLPTRHQTLQATIEWSHELCTRTEQLLWARASVFAGGFGIEAAEACCTDDKLPPAAVLDAVAGLVDKSILVRTERDGRLRFRLLEPLREYGSAQLLSMGEELEAHDRHLAWCANLVNEACMQWFGPAQERWCVTLRLESANLRAAAEHCLRQRDNVDVALRLVGDPWFLWVALFLDEGRYWLEKALALGSGDTPARAKALATAGYVTSLQGEFLAAESFLTESRNVAGMLEDTANQAYATHVLGVNALFTDPAKAVSLLREGLSLYGQVPEIYDDYVVGLRVQLGLALLFEADLDAAEEQFVTCRDLCTASGERWLLSYALYGLAFASYATGDLDSGFNLAEEALRIKRFFGDTWVSLSRSTCSHG